MAAGGCGALRWLAPLVALLAVVGCASRPDPALDWTAFDEAACPATSDADQCFELRAEAVGLREGRGRCDVMAVDEGGAPLLIGATYGPVRLVPGRSFEWFVELEDVGDPAFAAWEPRCVPLDEG